jgi:hypothetical protein
MAGPFFNVIGGKYADFSVIVDDAGNLVTAANPLPTRPGHATLADIFAVSHTNASAGILATHRAGGRLLAADLTRTPTRLRCWIRCSADATISYVKSRGATNDTYKPAGSTKVTALTMYVFEVPFTALDESFDVFIDTTATVSLVVEEV